MHDAPNAEMESQADEFAAELLMPRDEIKDELFCITLPRLAELKAYWKVSMGALLRRAKDCDRITYNQYRYFNIQMSKLGYRTSEPVILQHETPSVLTKIVELHLNHLGYSPADLAKVIAFPEDECASMYGIPEPSGVPAERSGYLRLVQ